MDTLVNKFGASDSVSDFIWYLEEFLLQHSLPIPSPALHNVPFGVFKRLSVMLPQIPQASDLTDLRDTIRTTLPEPSQARRKAVPAQFDTVLAFEKAGLTAFSDPSNPLKGAYLSFVDLVAEADSDCDLQRSFSCSGSRHLPITTGVWSIRHPTCICRVVYTTSIICSLTWNVSDFPILSKPIPTCINHTCGPNSSKLPSNSEIWHKDWPHMEFRECTRLCRFLLSQS